MDTKVQIIEKSSEIKDIVRYLMKAIKERIGQKRYNGDWDYQYPFELEFDELPYFSLYINLKKAVYENLLLKVYQDGELKDEDFQVLEEVNVIEENDTLKIKTMKDFVSKEKYLPCMALDLPALEEYLDKIENVLLYSKYSDPVAAILIECFDSERLVEKHIGKDGVLPEDYVDDDGYFDMAQLDDLKSSREGNWFCSQMIYQDNNIVAERYGKDFMFPCGEYIGLAFLQTKEQINLDTLYGKKRAIKEVHQDNDEPPKYNQELSNRQYVLKRINEFYYKRFCAVINTTVNILAISVYEIPHEIILEILQQTYVGMSRVVFAVMLKKYTLGKKKCFTKGQFMKALGVASEKFSKCTAIYGTVTFSENEIKDALKVIGQPSDLFEIPSKKNKIV